MNYGIKIFNNLHELENFFLTEQFLQLTYLKESWILYLCWSNISFFVCYPFFTKKARFSLLCRSIGRRAESNVFYKD